MRLAAVVVALVAWSAVQAAAAGAWGGEYTARTGETVDLSFSDTYPQDPARAQYWADFLAGLLHGPELSTVRLHLAPIQEVQRRCGFGAGACYSAFSGVIVAPGEPLRDGTSAEAIVAHEYGHHVAQNRNNPPWAAVDWGTKRWATHVKVCSQAGAGSLFPGDEGRGYRLNPGEGFAEAYRLLHDRRAGRPESWTVVDPILFPDATALALLEQDVVQPWTGNQSVRLSGSFSPYRGTVRTFGIPTPLDGTLRITLSPPAKTAFRMELYSGGRLVTSGARTVRTTVCGERAFTLRVTRTRGFGSFGVQVSRP
jgi:hypothetical protein